MSAETRASATVSSGCTTTDVNGAEARSSLALATGESWGSRSEGGRQPCHALGLLQRRAQAIGYLGRRSVAQICQSQQISRPTSPIHTHMSCSRAAFLAVLRSHHSLSLRAATPRSAPGWREYGGGGSSSTPLSADQTSAWSSRFASSAWWMFASSEDEYTLARCNDGFPRNDETSWIVHVDPGCTVGAVFSYRLRRGYATSAKTSVNRRPGAHPQPDGRLPAGILHAGQGRHGLDERVALSLARDGR